MNDRRHTPYRLTACVCCDGTGSAEVRNGNGEVETCGNCGGSGEVEVCEEEERLHA